MTLTKVYLAVQKLNEVIYDESTPPKIVDRLTDVRSTLMKYIEEQSLITKEEII